jgi:putative addiction module killer protein
MRDEFTAVVYQTAGGKKPFDEWLDKLRHKNRAAAEAVDARLARIRDKGNLGDFRSVGNAIFELRLHIGPGYRIYYLMHDRAVVVLLAGGEKGDQRRDIEKAYAYAADFRRRI